MRVCVWVCVVSISLTTVSVAHVFGSHALTSKKTCMQHAEGRLPAYACVLCTFAAVCVLLCVGCCVLLCVALQVTKVYWDFRKGLIPIIGGSR